MLKRILIWYFIEPKLFRTHLTVNINAVEKENVLILLSLLCSFSDQHVQWRWTRTAAIKRTDIRISSLVGWEISNAQFVGTPHRGIHPGWNPIRTYIPE